MWDLELVLPLHVAVIVEGAREAGDLELLRVVLEIRLREPVGQFTHLGLLGKVERLRQRLGCSDIGRHQDLQGFRDPGFRGLRLEFTWNLHDIKSTRT